MELSPTIPAPSAAEAGISRADTENQLTNDLRFAEAVEFANVATLLMVLVQLTGNLRWLEEPYRPRKARGFSDNESGGLSEDVQHAQGRVVVNIPFRMQEFWQLTDTANLNDFVTTKRA